MTRCMKKDILTRIIALFVLTSVVSATYAQPALTTEQERFDSLFLHAKRIAVQCDKVGAPACDSALAAASQALAVLEKTPSANSDGFPDIHLFLGDICHRKRSFDQAISHLELAVSLADSLYGAYNPVSGDAFHLLGLIEEYRQAPHRAIPHHQKSLSVRQQLTPARPLDEAKSHQRLGACYGNVKDRQREKDHLEFAWGACQKCACQDSPGCVSILLDLAKNARTSGRAEEAIQSYQRVLSNKTLSAQQSAGAWQGLANLYHKQKNYPQADSAYQRCIAIMEDSMGKDYSWLTWLYSDWGSLKETLGDTTEAIQRYKRVIEIAQNSVGNQHYSIGTAYFRIASVRFNSGKYTTALADVQKALIALNPGFEDANVSANPPLDRCVNYDYFRRALWLKARILTILSRQPSPSQGFYTENAKKTYQKCLDLVERYRNDLPTIGALSSDQSMMYSLFEEAIAAELYDAFFKKQPPPPSTFDIAEKSKATLLFSAVRSNQAIQFSNIPADLRQKEQFWKQQISQLEKQRTDESSKQTLRGDSAAMAVGTRLFRLREDYEALLKTLESAYPAYYRLKHDRATADLPAAQSLLAPGHTLLEYFVGDSSIYAFVLRPDRYQVTEIKRDFPLETLVQQMRDGLSGFYAQKDPHDTLYNHTLRQYITAAQSLYTHLIAPIEAQLADDTLVIVPDGVLGYLPFEALLSGLPPNPGNFGTYPFWLRKKQISYCYSATLLREMKQKQHKMPPIGNLLAFAPCYKGSEAELRKQFGAKPKPRPAASVKPKNSLTARGGFEPLPASGEEVYRISEAWRGRRFVHREGTVERFRQMAADYHILHLSTHGQANPEVSGGDNSYLVFAAEPTDSGEYELLYVRDLYNFQLNADLVTLSACETGIGELQRGEGVVSLARAFAYAGAKSIVTSLWATNDGATKELMEIFYEELRQPGHSKDAALRAAKLRYLSDFPGEQAHPFFWAAFVPIGDMAPIKSK